MSMSKLVIALSDIRDEQNNLLKFMRSLNLSPSHKVLDIGCGFGAKLTLLGSQGVTITGVDVNEEIIASNLKAGMNCLSLSDFNRTTDLYDVLLMSHVIEHFQPADLLKFMDAYLDRLKTGGHLIIATPLMSLYFYDDFDHVKPYHPTGIEMVFGCSSAQVQYASRNKIELVDIWFRRGPFKIIAAPGLYISKYSRAPMILNSLLAILFKLSFGMVGRANGWMGLYKKVPQ
jgi:SAM-dependent methyltransferase